MFNTLEKTALGLLLSYIFKYREGKKKKRKKRNAFWSFFPEAPAVVHETDEKH